MSQIHDDITGLIESANLDEAERRIAALSGEDTRAEKLYLEGRVAEQRYDWNTAIEKYRAAADVDENHREGLFHLAYLLDLRGDDEEAMSLYEECIAETPAPVNAVLNLAVLYEDHGRYDEALTLVRGVVNEHPNHVRARLFLGDVQNSLTMYYDEEREASREQRSAILDTPISDFELSVRSRNCLKQMNINTIGDLLRITEAKLLAYKNFGETSLNEIKEMLRVKGLRLGQALEDGPVTPSVGAPPPPAVAGIAAGDPNILNRSVAELELSVRSRKCLQRLGISTLGELIQRSEAELMAIKNFGQTSLVEIKRRLGELGLGLRESAV
ncbi:MAG: tetratricopeptide repeat protein [Phycisphaerales bacterium]|nr:tetratricopeptide repeat protein [Phycisphaerales bacterium]